MKLPRHPHPAISNSGAGGSKHQDTTLNISLSGQPPSNRNSMFLARAPVRITGMENEQSAFLPGRLGEQKPLPEQCLAGPLCVHQCGSALDTTALVIPASSEMGGDQPVPRKTSVAMSLGLRRTSRKAQTLGEAQDLPAFLRAEMLFNSFKAAMINGTATGPSKGR